MSLLSSSDSKLSRAPTLTKAEKYLPVLYHMHKLSHIHTPIGGVQLWTGAGCSSGKIN